MSKKDRFCAAYEHLRHIDKIRTQQDLADVMGSTSQFLIQFHANLFTVISYVPSTRSLVLTVQSMPCVNLTWCVKLLAERASL